MIDTQRRARAPVPRRRGHRGERGLTLIELLVAIALIGTAAVGVAYGFAAIVRTGTVTQDQARLEVASRQLSDFIRSRGALPYVACATAATYTLPSAPAGLRWTITTVSIGTSAKHNGVSETPVSTCLGRTGGGGDWGVQEITIRVSSVGRSLSRVVWKASV